MTRLHLVPLALGLLTAAAAAQQVRVEPQETVEDGDVDVAAGHYKAFSVPLAQGNHLSVSLAIRGGLNDRVSVWLLDLPNFDRFQHGQPFASVHGSAGPVRNGFHHLFTAPARSVYYLVLDNRKALFLQRAVHVVLTKTGSTLSPDEAELRDGLQKFYVGMKGGLIFDDFNIYVGPCGVENAFSRDKLLVMCSELLISLQKQRLGNAVVFVLFHELGHSLLRSWGLPLFDNEDAADEFATVFMMMGEKQDIALDGARWFENAAGSEDARAKLWLDDRHSLSPQRARNVVRWLNQGALLLARWQKLIVPHMRVSALRYWDSQQKPWIDHELVRRELASRASGTQP